MKPFKIFPLLPFLFFILSGCAKFEDGPLISFKSQMERLQGDWIVTYFTVSGVDSLQILNDYFGSKGTFFFERTNSNDQKGLSITWGNTASNYYHAGGLYTGINKNDLHITAFTPSDLSTYHPFWFLEISHPNSTYVVEWPITRLKCDEIWFEMDVNGKYYQIHLENINKY